MCKILSHLHHASGAFLNCPLGGWSCSFSGSSCLHLLGFLKMRKGESTKSAAVVSVLSVQNNPEAWHCTKCNFNCCLVKKGSRKNWVTFLSLRELKATCPTCLEVTGSTSFLWGKGAQHGASRVMHQCRKDVQSQVPESTWLVKEEEMRGC